VKLSDIVETLNLEPLTPELHVDGQRVSGAHVGDLLSDALVHAPRGGLLVTAQVHLNVIAVAVHGNLAGVIFVAGRRPTDAVRRRAVEQGILAFASRESALDVAGKLYNMGIRGRSG